MRTMMMIMMKRRSRRTKGETRKGVLTEKMITTEKHHLIIVSFDKEKNKLMKRAGFFSFFL